MVLLKSQDLGLQKGGRVGRKVERSEERKNVSPPPTSFVDLEMHCPLTTHFPSSNFWGEQSLPSTLQLFYVVFLRQTQSIYPVKGDILHSKDALKRLKRGINIFLTRSEESSKASIFISFSAILSLMLSQPFWQSKTMKLSRFLQ
jgi:hypothetical protein